MKTTTYLMASPKNPQPAQISHCLKRPCRSTSNCITAHRRVLKCALSTVRNRVRNSEATEPITDPICVASPDECGDARLHDRRERREEGARICLSVSLFHSR